MQGIIMENYGVLPSQEIRELLEQILEGNQGNPNGAGVDRPYNSPDESQIQPASFEPSLGQKVYRITARPTADELQLPALPSHSYLFDFTLDEEGKTIENNCTYLIELREKFLHLPKDVRGYANNKSSSGRINLQVKLTNDKGDDILTETRTGATYVRVMSKLSPLKIHAGDRLNQIRFIYGNAELDDLEIRLREKNTCFMYDKSGGHVLLTADNLNGGLIAHLDLAQEIVGYKARKNPNCVLDLSRRAYNAGDFWDELKVDEHGRLLLEAGEFYILATKEKISVPPSYAMEMIPYNLTAGEFRSHYAGFFDPGFGWSADGSIRGTAATLEVIPYENMYVRDGAVICKFKVERMRSIPDKIYGEGIGSNYQNQQAPRLAKYFSG